MDSSFFEKLLIDFKPNDFLDILFITLIVYFFIKFLIRIKFWQFLFVLTAILLFYFLAFWLNLPLSKYFFNYAFQILVIILVIVFQKELRKMFEPLIFSKIKILKTKKHYFEEIIHQISETLNWLQKNKAGALIVFLGLEEIESYIEGGFSLNGKMSPQILMSIFDKNSPGHDGAVIINYDRIIKFGVHLPLAENTEIIKKYGTRHRAALGISEKTDALVVIVSEETGKISVAHEGNLKTFNSLFEIQEVLNSFFKEKYSHQLLKEKKSIFKNFILPFSSSFILSLFLWFFFNFQTSIIQKNFLIPIEFYNIPNNLILENLSDSQIVITLIGKERDFKILNEKNLKAVIDISKLEEGWHRLLIRKENIKNIKDFDLVKIEPSTIKFQLKTIEDKE